MRVTLAVLLASLALSGSARGESARTLPPAARAHQERGVELYAEGKYRDAAKEFEVALTIVDHPDLWYALAQTQRKLGQCEVAIVSYRHFLDSGPPRDEADRAEINLRRCKAELESRPATSTPDPAAAPPPAQPVRQLSTSSPPPRDQVTRAEQDSDTLKILGLGVTGVGTVVLGFGVYFALRARSDWGVVNEAAARHEQWSPELERRYESAEKAETKATVLLVAGGAIVVAGGFLYYLAVRNKGPAAALADGMPGKQRRRARIGCGFGLEGGAVGCAF